MSKNDLVLPRKPEFYPDTDRREQLCSEVKMLQLHGGGVPQLGVFKITPEAIIPAKATPGSACFDIHACIVPNNKVIYYNNVNEKGEILLVKNALHLFSSDRYLIPTGIILDIPIGYSVRLHPRSGLSLKSGLVLTNCEGVIDNDYVEPLFVMMSNISRLPVSVKHGDRICQGELVKSEAHSLREIFEKPLVKTSRNGGFGSTGS